jgi:hypothetical protein
MLSQRTAALVQRFHGFSSRATLQGQLDTIRKNIDETMTNKVFSAVLLAAFAAVALGECPNGMYSYIYMLHRFLLPLLC